MKKALLSGLLILCLTSIVLAEEIELTNEDLAIKIDTDRQGMITSFIDRMTGAEFIEKSDQDLMDWIKNVTIPTFSEYIPDKEYAPVVPSDEKYQNARTGWYHFFDEEDLDIYDIIECYFGVETLAATNHPIVGVSSFEGMTWWSLDIFKSRNFGPISLFSGYTYKYIAPNIVEVLPDYTNAFVVKYEREQPHDLRRIPNPTKREFMDLCLADIKLWIGGMRTHYGNIQTPWGEINLKGDELKSEGEALKNETVTKLDERSIPPVIIDIS